MNKTFLTLKYKSRPWGDEFTYFYENNIVVYILDKHDNFVNFKKEVLTNVEEHQ